MFRMFLFFGFLKKTKASLAKHMASHASLSGDTKQNSLANTDI
jgi:hypothetical protein